MKSSQVDPPPNLSLYQSQRESQNSSPPDRDQYEELRPSQSPFFAPRTVSPDGQEQISRELSRSTEEPNTAEPAVLDFQKRNTALLEAAASNCLPPKRELPFPKPREVLPRSASASDISTATKQGPISRPNSAENAMNAAKNGKRKVQDTTPVIKPVKKRVAQRKPAAIKASEIAESPPPKERDTASISKALPEDESSPLAAKSQAASPRPASAATGLQTKAAAAPKKRPAPAREISATKRPKMTDQSTQTDVALGSDCATTLPSWLDANPASAARSGLNSSSTPPQEYLNAIDTFVTKHKARPAPKELWQNPGWAQADEEQRQTLLNNFICENLQNKDFVKLCGDTAVAWKRIGFGI